MKFHTKSEIKTICIVDDDQGCQLALQMMVHKLFETAEIKIFDNGIDAYDYCDTAESIDMIFTDINMPGLSGDQLAVKIKEKNKKVLVFGVSGMDPTEEYLKIFDEVLTKPITMNSLNESLIKVFGNKQN